MHSLKDLQDDHLLSVLESAYLSVQADETVASQFKNGDVFSVMVLNPTVIAFTVSFSENNLHWKIGTDGECPSIIWKEKKHFLEWLEGKRGILKLVMMQKFKVHGKIPAWVNALNLPLRKYISEKVLVGKP